MGVNTFDVNPCMGCLVKSFQQQLTLQTPPCARIWGATLVPHITFPPCSSSTANKFTQFLWPGDGGTRKLHCVTHSTSNTRQHPSHRPAHSSHSTLVFCHVIHARRGHTSCHATTEPCYPQQVQPVSIITVLAPHKLQFSKCTFLNTPRPSLQLLREAAMHLPLSTGSRKHQFG